MSNQIDNPKDQRLAGLARVAGDLHNVAKQAPFRIAFRVDFGGQNHPKIDEISSFGAFRFAFAFWDAKLMIFGGARGWKSLILLRKNKVFRDFHLLPPESIFHRFSSSKMLRNPLKFASKRYRFFDMVFEANFNDFRLQFEVQKPFKFHENLHFWEPWKEIILWNTLGFDFGVILVPPGAKIGGFWLEKASKSEDFYSNLDAKSKPGLFQTSSGLIFWETCADD